MKLFAVGVLALVAACPSKKARENELDAVFAKMAELADKMCMCKDKACANHVQDEMTRWSQDLARDANANSHLTPNERQTKKLTEDSTKYAECMSKLMIAETPPPDVPPPSTKKDVDALIRSARDWARVARPKHRLVEVTAWFVDANGMLDPEHGKLYVEFGHPARGDDPKRKTGAPVTTSVPAGDCFGLHFDDDKWTRGPAPCNSGHDAGIHCPIREIWKRAIAADAPADALATVSIKPSATKTAEWGFWISDEPRDVRISHAFPDDCPLAVEK